MIVWNATQGLCNNVSHPFSAALTRVLDKHGFDEYVESACAPFDATTMGRLSHHGLLGLASESKIKMRYFDGRAHRHWL